MNGPVPLRPRPARPGAGERGGAGRSVLSLFLGGAFTLGLFWSIAHYETAAPESPPAELDDLRISVLPVQPPPLPAAAPAATTPEVTPMAGFDYAPSESAVKLAVSPPSAENLLPEELSKAPSPGASFDLRPTDFRPKMDFSSDPQHIFEKSEVDEIPRVLDRGYPRVSSRVRNNADQLQVKLLCVVETSGVVTHVQLVGSSGNARFDDVMVDYLQGWVFSPGMKHGKKVRTKLMQPITVKWGAGSPFQT